LREKEQLAAGVTPDYIRVLLGTERSDDLTAGFDRPLRAWVLLVFSVLFLPGKP
jgi:O-acetylhomoserine/O-acetylserine sulfhydrylase-like pyridoxal-dependent enzyme